MADEQHRPTASSVYKWIRTFNTIFLGSYAVSGISVIHKDWSRTVHAKILAIVILATLFNLYEVLAAWRKDPVVLRSKRALMGCICMDLILSAALLFSGVIISTERQNLEISMILLALLSGLHIVTLSYSIREETQRRRREAEEKGIELEAQTTAVRAQRFWELPREEQDRVYRHVLTRNILQRRYWI